MSASLLRFRQTLLGLASLFLCLILWLVEISAAMGHLTWKNGSSVQAALIVQKMVDTHQTVDHQPGVPLWGRAIVWWCSKTFFPLSISL